MSIGVTRIADTFFDLRILQRVFPQLIETGLPNTLILSAGAMVVGLVAGLIFALVLLSKRPWVRAIGRTYVNIFRGIPHIVSIYIIGEGLPLAGISIFGSNTYLYAMLAIGIVEGSYISEILRSGIRGIARGQFEAGEGVGMTHSQVMRHVILPQAARNILPALTGQLNLVIKNTALVFLLGLGVNQRELFSIAQDSSSNNASLTPFVAAGIMYLAITLPLSYFVTRLDRRMGRGGGRVRGVSKNRDFMAPDFPSGPLEHTTISTGGAG
ncbi:MAG: amino acid ABC transporter permease [Acidimicrobiales bacterium]